MTNPILSDADIDLAAMHGTAVAIIGYGNQGRAQALNLRDSGITVHIGLRPGSSREALARDDGFDPQPMADAAAAGE